MRYDLTLFLRQERGCMLKNLSKLVILFSITASAFAGVLYVDGNINDGFWQGAYGSLQNALNAAQAGDEIWVAQGSYTPGAERSESFILKEGVKIYGGFFGGETSRNDREVYSNATILSGNIGLLEDDVDNSAHVVYGSGTLSQATVLDGFVITGGYADDGQGGGGMLLENGAEPLISHCHFIDNHSTTGGGAVALQNGAAFRHCLFELNTADMGGAVYCPENRTQTGNSSYDLCTFVQNTAGSGSAMYFGKRETAMIDSSVFWKNMNNALTINTFDLDTRAGSYSAITNSAVDDASVTAVTVSNIIYYSSSQIDGPFKDTDMYILDSEHGIPADYGWYYIPAPLVLNIKVFLEGTF